MERARAEAMFRYYVTDALRVIGETLAHAFGGSYLSERLCDIMRSNVKDSRTGDEIARDVLSQISFSGGEKT